MSFSTEQTSIDRCSNCSKRIAVEEVIKVTSLFAQKKFSSYCQDCAADVVRREKSFPIISGASGLLILLLGLGAIFAAFNLPTLSRLMLVCLCLPSGFAFLWFSYELKQRIFFIREQLQELAAK